MLLARLQGKAQRAVAAQQATASGADPLLLVLAADPVIRDAERVRATVAAGVPAAPGSLPRPARLSLPVRP